MGRKSTVRKADLIQAIEEENGDIEALVERFGRSRQTIKHRIEVLGLEEMVQAARREYLVWLIRSHGGIVAAMARTAERSRQTIYDWLDDFDLRGLVQKYRGRLYDMGVDNVMYWIDQGDPVMTRWALERFPGGPKWSTKTEVEVTGIPISDEALRVLADAGITREDAAAQFEAIVRAMAESDAG